MIALNRNEIKNKSISFWALFGSLLLSTLIVVYFFVWSSHMESAAYLSKIQENRTAINKQIALQPKVDSLYNLIGKLEFGSVDNYMFLESYIKDQKNSIKQIIGNDSMDHFSGYNKLVSRLDEQIILRDTIINLVRTGEDIRMSLLRCNSRNKSIGKSLIRGSRQ
jgi:hypothetical protein